MTDNTTIKKSIKETYQKHLWTFIVINAAIFWSLYIYGEVSYKDVEITFMSFFDKKTLLFALLPLLTIILNGIISNALKEFIVFWKVKNRLPGHRAFSRFVEMDSRVDKNSLIQKYGEFPNNPKEQNSLWYKIYKQHNKVPIIWNSHRDFLLTRDLASLGFIFIIVFGIAAFFIEVTLNTQIIYLSFLLMQVLILAITAKNYGNRFVCNVLAIAS